MILTACVTLLLKQLKDLSIGDEVAIYPFKGVEYEKPSSDIIIDKGIIKNIDRKEGKEELTPS